MLKQNPRIFGGPRGVFPLRTEGTFQKQFLLSKFAAWRVLLLCMVLHMGLVLPCLVIIMHTSAYNSKETNVARFWKEIKPSMCLKLPILMYSCWVFVGCALCYCLLCIFGGAQVWKISFYCAALRNLQIAPSNDASHAHTACFNLERKSCVSFVLRSWNCQIWKERSKFSAAHSFGQNCCAWFGPHKSTRFGE